MRQNIFCNPCVPLGLKQQAHISVLCGFSKEPTLEEMCLTCRVQCSISMFPLVQEATRFRTSARAVVFARGSVCCVYVCVVCMCVCMCVCA